MTDDLGCSGRRVLIILAGLVVASGVLAAFFELTTQLRGSYTPALLIFAAFAAVFGLPIYLVRLEDKKDSLLSAVVTGAVISGVPMLLLSLLSREPLMVIALPIWFGMMGAAGGAIFWMLVVYLDSPGRATGPSTPSRRRTIFSCVLAAALIGACFLPS